MSADTQPSNVVNLRSHRNYRPDMAAIARKQFSEARSHLDQTEEEFAATLGQYLTWIPTAGAVRGWETNVAPPSDVLLAARFVSSGDTDIPPVGYETERLAGDPDVSRVYATRRHLARPDWQGIIADCTDCIWLDGMAEQGYAKDDDVPDILERAAAEGCDIRILLLDPDYPGIGDIDAYEGSPPGTLASRIRSSLYRFGRMARKCGGRMEIRTYSALPSVSIVRGDGRMLVTHYLRFFAGGDSPTLLLEAQPGGELFSRYERHFHRLWDDAKEYTAA